MNILPPLSPTTSIRRRLSLYLGSGLFTLWLLAAIGGITLSLHETNEAADTQMAQLAHTLLQLAPHTPHTPKILVDFSTFLPGDNGNGDTDSDKHGFAVWDADGKRLLADHTGESIPYRPLNSFVNTGPFWRSDSWRRLYLHDSASGHTVAVTQHLGERLSILAEAGKFQILLSLATLPLFLWLIAYGIRRALAPLDKIARDLHKRDARSLQALTENVPAEILPLVQALNGLLTRIHTLMEHERRFTADAAHELRSPLAALHIQCDALALASDDTTRQHHLAHIRTSITRARHLIDQLLILARLDAGHDSEAAQPVHWLPLVEEILASVNIDAREKRIRLHLQQHGDPAAHLPMHGHPALLRLLLRNLLNNAIRYSPANSRIDVHLGADGIRICDQGPGIAQDELPRIRERFYRPAGQSEPGSGLGLSIADSIAQLHGLALHLDNRPAGGLCVHIVRQQENDTK